MIQYKTLRRKNQALFWPPPGPASGPPSGEPHRFGHRRRGDRKRCLEPLGRPGEFKRMTISTGPTSPNQPFRLIRFQRRGSAGRNPRSQGAPVSPSLRGAATLFQNYVILFQPTSQEKNARPPKTSSKAPLMDSDMATFL